MKLTVTQLRRLIIETLELPQDIEEVLSNIMTSVVSGESDVTQRVVIAERPHVVRLVVGPDGYEARVDSDLFGVGKRPATAVNFIRKRLQFLMTDKQVSHDPRSLSKDDYDELKRREKLDRDRWGKR